MSRLGAKPPMMGSEVFGDLCDTVSKAALIDALWCACQLGTDESAEQITTAAARNILAALHARGDRPVVADRLRLEQAAGRRIDSDPASGG